MALFFVGQKADSPGFAFGRVLQTSGGCGNLPTACG
jgi:hypothetical protein